MTGSPIRVMIADDHEALAASLLAVLDQEDDMVGVGVAGTIAQARAMVGSAAPDVLLLDHRMPDGDGVGAIPELLRLRPGLRVAVLTASPGDHLVVEAIEAGACGFVSKTRSLAEVAAAVRAAASGEAVISPELLARVLPRLHGGATTQHKLTDREREVLDLVAEGLSNAAIAERLVVSVHTVRNHIANLSAKLGAHSKLEALAIAVRQGLLPGR
jgi:DNA-binding NarL/FixJ family response regulator